MKKIILSGYMGCGKSVTAQSLHEKTGLKVIDLDNFIEKKSGFSIRELFKNKGEIHFRKLETLTLMELMQSPETFILSLGGGTPCYGNNAELLKNPSAITVYLRASIDTLYDRLILEKQERPLIAGMKDDELKEFIAKHLFERRQYYNLANFKIDTDSKSPDDVASEILSLLA